METLCWWHAGKVQSWSNTTVRTTSTLALVGMDIHPREEGSIKTQEPRRPASSLELKIPAIITNEEDLWKLGGTPRTQSIGTFSLLEFLGNAGGRNFTRTVPLTWSYTSPYQVSNCAGLLCILCLVQHFKPDHCLRKPPKQKKKQQKKQNKENKEEGGYH